jgi:hypothetical protein
VIESQSIIASLTGSFRAVAVLASAFDLYQTKKEFADVDENQHRCIISFWFLLIFKEQKINC